MIFAKNKRIDGRAFDQVRPISVLKLDYCHLLMVQRFLPVVELKH